MADVAESVSPAPLSSPLFVPDDYHNNRVEFEQHYLPIPDNHRRGNASSSGDRLERPPSIISIDDLEAGSEDSDDHIIEDFISFLDADVHWEGNANALLSAALGQPSQPPQAEQSTYQRRLEDARARRAEIRSRIRLDRLRARMDRSPRVGPPRDRLVGIELAGQQNGRNRESSRPAAQHAVIDLTMDDDNDGVQRASQSRPESQNARRRQSQQRTNTPPRLNRTDGSYVGDRQVIDLTEDLDSPVQEQRPQNVVAANERRSHSHHRHHHHPRLPRPQRPAHLPGQRARLERNSAVPAPEELRNPIIPGMQFFHAFSLPRGLHDFLLLGNPGNAAAGAIEIDDAGEIPEDIARLAANMDYRRNAFQQPPKPAHEPPPAARDGFTRNTGEEITAICPSCDEELAYDPESTDEPGKPTKKARSRKDQAEHHFWAVKTCGHVYCKRCFDNRKLSGKAAGTSTGFEVHKTGKQVKVTCAVDGCISDVTQKSAWIGIFL